MIAMLTNDPGLRHAEQGLRNDSPELNDTKDQETISEPNPQGNIEERTDYSYDPDDEWIQMHLGKKMEENY